MNFDQDLKDIIKKTEGLSLENQSKKIYLDVPNMRDFFFKSEDHWDMEKAKNSIEKFLQSSKKEGWEILGFSDYKRITSEVRDVYKKRREYEIEDEIKKFPAVLYEIFHYAFLNCGVPIHYNIEADNDDTLASWANHDNACVFSRDRDFFRYKEKNYDVYNRFQYHENGKIEFFYSSPGDKEYNKPARNIISPKPKTFMRDPEKPFDISLEEEEILFGSGSALTKYLGNIYINLKPLRQAVYFRLKGKPRKEIIPYWDPKTKKVEWENSLLEINSKYDYLLKDPYECIEELFNMKELMKRESEFSKTKWKNHLFSIYSLSFFLFTMLESHSQEKLFNMLVDVRKKLFGDKYKSNLVIEEPPKQIICNKCSNLFELPHSEEKFFKEKGLCLPKSCKGCRKARKANEEKKKDNYSTSKQKGKELDFNFRNKNK